MASVPFNPFPNAATENTPLAARSSATTFGGASAEGLSGIGNELIQAGTRLSGLRLAHAGMTNELIANDQSTTMMKEVTQLYGEFSKKEGRAAYEALPGFQKELDSIYQRNLTNLPNLDAKVQAGRALKYVSDTYYHYAESYASSQFKTWQQKSAQGRAAELGTQAQMAIDHPEKMDAFLGASDDEIRKLGETRFLDEQSITDEVKANRGKNVGNLIDTLLAGDDVNSAEALFDKYRNQIDGDSQVTILKALKPAVLNRDASVIKDLAIRRAGLAEGGFDIDRAKNAIARIESGGHYFILGQVLDNGDQAIGKYQVMKSNIPAWTREALGKELTPEQFLRSPEAQEKVFEYKFGEYVQKYGNVADAASAWFTGRPLKEGANSRDVFGTSGTGYVNQFLYGYGSDTGVVLQSDGLPSRQDAMASVLDLTEDDPALRTRSITFLNQEYTVASAAYTDQERQKQQVKDAQKAADEAAQNEYIALSMSKNPPPDLAQRIAHDPRLEATSKRTMMAFVNADGDTPTEVSRATLSKLLERMRLPAGDQNKITTLDPAIQSVVDNQLSKADYNFFSQQYRDQTTPEGERLSTRLGQFFDAYKVQIQGQIAPGIVDPEKGANFYAFQSMVNGEIANAKNKGEDPFALLDPANSKFLGNPALVTSFQRPMQDIISSSLRKIVGSTAQPVPFSSVLSPAGLDNLASVYKKNLLAQGMPEADAEKQTQTYRTSLATPTPYVQPQVQPGETPDQYIGRTSGLPSMLPEDFRDLDPDKQLIIMDQYLGKARSAVGAGKVVK